jgi:hypothetical protein
VPEVEWQDQKDPGFKIPGCADRFMLGADPPLSPAGAQCPNYEASGVPKNVFSGEKGDLFAEFCKGIDTQKESSMTVDSEGKKIEKRAPPPDPDTWKGYKFTFNFKPDGKEACRKTCEEAYKAIQASSCGDREMPKTAYIDAGCGVYSYTIEIPKNQDDPPQNPPKQELVLGERECLSSGDKANDGFVPEYIGSACAGSSLPESNIKKDTKPPNQKFHTRTNDVTYTFNVYWKEGCETSVDEVNMFAPLPDSTDEINNCLSLMQDNHEKCKFDVDFRPFSS